MADIVIFYDRDPDGIAAAITVARHYTGKSIAYHPAIRYQGPNMDDIGPNTIVFIVDFCYKKKFMEPLCKTAEQVIVLDHHGESTDNDLEGFSADNLTVVNDNKHAACVVAWSFMNFEDANNAPSILQFIQDMDLWTWKLPNSKIVSAFLDSVEPSIEAYWPFLTGEMSLEDVLVQGEAILAYKNKTMDILEKQAVLMEIAGYKVPAVNCSDPSIVSYLGNRLSQGYPFAATYYRQPNLKWKFSIRSVANGLNVRKIAERFGGGGHERASGFKVDTLFRAEKMDSSELVR